MKTKTTLYFRAFQSAIDFYQWYMYDHTGVDDLPVVIGSEVSISQNKFINSTVTFTSNSDIMEIIDMIAYSIIEDKNGNFSRSASINGIDVTDVIDAIVDTIETKR